MEQHNDETLTLEEAIKWLKKDNYLVEVAGSLIWTEKFKKDYGKENLSLVPVKLSSSVPARLVVKEPDKVDLFKEFVLMCEIPTKLPLGNGGFYWANRYNEKAADVLQKLLNDPKINNQALVLSTKLYYKAENTGREMIGNYLTRGTWRSAYDEFVEKAREGAKSLEDYVREQMSSGNGESIYSQVGN